MLCAAPPADGSSRNSIRASSSASCRPLTPVTGRWAKSAGVSVDRPERRKDEVAAGGQRPVDRERGREEQAGPQVREQDERERDHDGDEDEEQLVDARQRVRGDAAAEQAVQQVGGVVAREQRAVEVGQTAVERLAAEQRHDALEVAIGEVGDVEADQGAADRQRPRGGPARAAGAEHDVRGHQQRDERGRDHEAPEADAGGVAQRHTRLARHDQRRNERDGGYDRSRGDGAPRGRRVVRERSSGHAAFIRCDHRREFCLDLGVDAMRGHSTVATLAVPWPGS